MLSIAVVDDEQAFSDALIRMIRQFLKSPKRMNRLTSTRMIPSLSSLSKQMKRLRMTGIPSKQHWTPTVMCMWLQSGKLVSTAAPC